MKFWIVEISDFLPGLDGGNRLYRAGMLAEALVKRGHKVLWWTSSFNHQLRKQRFYESTTVNLKENYRLRLLYGPGYRRSISLGRIKHNRVTAKEFARETENIPAVERPDLIYACLPTLEVSEKAVFYGSRHAIPVVVDIRDPWPEIYLSLFPPVIKPLCRIFLGSEFDRARRILSRAGSITAVSETNLEWGIRIARREAGRYDKWFPLGFPHRTQENTAEDEEGAGKIKREYGIERDSLVITYVGSFSPTCNFKTVMEAARRFAQKGESRVKFIMAGNGAQENFLRAQAKKNPNVVIAGWCERPKIDKILSMSSVGLAPYVSGAPQTLPNKPFEYMAAGLPILSSLEGECRRLIETESIGAHYISGSSADLFKKITWFFDHPAETKQMGINARKLLESKFSADIIYPQMADHLENIVKSKKIPSGCD